MGDQTRLVDAKITGGETGARGRTERDVADQPGSQVPTKGVCAGVAAVQSVQLRIWFCGIREKSEERRERKRQLQSVHMQIPWEVGSGSGKRKFAWALGNRLP
jgi:hypothetical protein